jgi:hypothetical protein
MRSQRLAGFGPFPPHKKLQLPLISLDFLRPGPPRPPSRSYNSCRVLGFPDIVTEPQFPKFVETAAGVGVIFIGVEDGSDSNDDQPTLMHLDPQAGYAFPPSGAATVLASGRRGWGLERDFTLTYTRVVLQYTPTRNISLYVLCKILRFTSSIYSVCSGWGSDGSP